MRKRPPCSIRTRAFSRLKSRAPICTSRRFPASGRSSIQASSTGGRRSMPDRTRPLRGAFPRLWAFAMEHLLLLPAGAAIALVWVNASPETYYGFVYAIAFVVNDVAMVFFFALMTKEVVEAA